MSNPFLSAFSKEPENDEASNGEFGKPSASREELFRLAFGQDPNLKDYAPEPILDYDFVHVAGTDAGKLGLLDALMKDGVQYRDLPMGLRDLVKPKRPLANELRRQEDESGMNLEQREKLFNALQFNVDYLSELAEAGMSGDMILGEYSSLKKRFPELAIDELLAETNQQLLAMIKAGEKAQEHAAKAAAAKEAELAKEQSVEDEIRAAQEAIAAMNAKAASDLEKIPADVLQQELTRRAAAQTRAGADQE